MGNICYIELGSNEDTDGILLLAKLKLHQTFPNIRFSRLQHTRPIKFHSNRLFFNQTACFNSELTSNEIKCILKSIEKDCGRQPEDKEQGIVRIDLDLILYGNTILKPSDMQRKYIQEGIKELSEDINL